MLHTTDLTHSKAAPFAPCVQAFLVKSSQTYPQTALNALSQTNTHTTVLPRLIDEVHTSFLDVGLIFNTVLDSFASAAIFPAVFRKWCYGCPWGSKEEQNAFSSTATHCITEQMLYDYHWWEKNTKLQETDVLTLY